MTRPKETYHAVHIQFECEVRRRRSLVLFDPESPPVPVWENVFDQMRREVHKLCIDGA